MHSRSTHRNLPFGLRKEESHCVQGTRKSDALMRGQAAYFSRKLQSNKFVIAKVGSALAGSLVLGAIPAFADNLGMENRRDAWQNFMNSNPGVEGKELRQLLMCNGRTNAILCRVLSRSPFFKTSR